MMSASSETLTLTPTPSISSVTTLTSASASGPYSRRGVPVSTSLAVHPTSAKRISSFSPATRTYSGRFEIPYHGSWEGQLSELCDVVESNESLGGAQIVELQCRKQLIGVILHRFLIMKLRLGSSEDDGDLKHNSYAFLRLDRRADPSATIGVIIRRGGATDSNDCAMLSRWEETLLKGPSSAIETGYPLSHLPPLLSSLVPFLRICSEELVRYCIWPDNCWFFCSLITSFLADQCPDDFDVSHLKNMSLAGHVRRRIRIRYHISSGRPIEELSYAEQLEFILSASKGEVIGSKKSAQELIKLQHTVHNTGAKRKAFTFIPSLMAFSPLHFLKGIRLKREWLTVSLSETLHDVRRHPQKTLIFQDVSKRFRDEAAMRGLAPVSGCRATADLANIGWTLVKYRLYLPAPDAALLMRSVERLARQLLEKEPGMYHYGLLHETLTAYGEELSGEAASVTGEPIHKKRDTFCDAVKMARLLNETEPGAHLDSLADSLGSYSLALAELGEYDKASEACRESIELWRVLYAQQIAERVAESESDEGTHWQQVFRDFCWCFCTDDGACDAITEVLGLAEMILTDSSPVEALSWPQMDERYGAFLRAAAAAPDGCKTIQSQRPR